MADKDIKIGIKTTADVAGAKAAANAINKVDAAADAAGSQLGGTAGLAGKAKVVEQQLHKTAKAADAAGNSSRAMNAKIQNLGYQAADVAVQLEMGTSALRTFTQQGSQMLGVLGPWGAITGAALAIGGALISSSRNSQEFADSIDELDGALADVTERMQELASKRGEATGQAWVEALNDEETAIIRQNIALAAQIEILEARRLSQMSIDRADRERRKAEIEANEELSPAEKIRGKAQIDSEGARAEADSQIIALKSGVEAAQKDAEDKAAAEDRIAADLAAAKAEKVRIEREKKEVDRAIRDLDNAVKAQPEVEKRKKEFERDRMMRIGFDTSADTSDLDKAIEALELRLEKAKNAPSTRSRLSARQSELAGQMQPTADAVKSLSDSQESARQAAAAARANAEKELALAREKQRGITGSFEATDAASRIRSEAAAREAEARDAQRKDQERQRAEEQQRKAASDAQSRATSEAGIGREALRLLPKDVSEGFRKAVMDVTKRLQDGDQGGEIKALSALMERLADAVQVRGTKTSIDIKNLESRIKQLENR